jgi:hypothetical protein
MSTFSSLKGKSQSIAKIGFWSSLLTAFLNLWYLIAFIIYQPILHAPWNGIEAYAESFQQLPFLAWVIPCFLLTLAFLMMIITIYISVEEENKIWSLFALVFAVIYTTILSTSYYIQMTVVRYNLIHNKTDGISLWLYANYYPYSIPGALEGVGYFFMCLSFLCVSRVFSQEKLERWVRWLFTAAGISGLLVFTDPLVKLPTVLVLIDLGIAGIVMTIGPILLAVLFRRKNSPV